MYRATTKDGRVVIGYYVKTDEDSWIIELELTNEDISVGFSLEERDPSSCGCYKIDPSTLARDTTVKDKNDTPIYGSFPVDGKMSEGGDRVRLGDNSPICEVKWQQEYARWICYWDDPEDGPSYVLPIIGQLEVIGNQMEKK